MSDPDELGNCYPDELFVNSDKPGVCDSDEPYVLVLYGSEKDKGFVERITSKLVELGRSYSRTKSSAHKETENLLRIMDSVKDKCIVYITVAGKSNALSGVVAGNDKQHPVIACPPLEGLEYLINIHSSLQMPSNVPVATITNPENAAIFADTILKQVEKYGKRKRS